jgi:hypothetical protein
MNDKAQPQGCLWLIRSLFQKGETKMSEEKTPTNEDQFADLDPRTHRRLLNFFNAANTLEDLAFAPQAGIPPQEAEPVVRRPDVSEQREPPEQLIDLETALGIMQARDAVSPIHGFAHVDQIRELIGRFNLVDYIAFLLRCMGPARFGEWSTVGPIHNDQGQPIDVVHAALLHTGWVMFIEAACGLAASRTPIWNPFNRATVEIKLPASPTDNLYCSGHSFLSDGRLLVVGGGGDLGATPHPNFGWIFDPVAGPNGTWSFTKDNANNRTRMHFDRWYPTLVTLGDVPARVLIASDNNSMEIYEEATGTFALVTATGSNRAFRPRYPGLHLLPGGEIFYAPVGFANSGSAPAPFPGNEPSGYWTFDNTNSLAGAWTNLQPNDRTKGMSVLLLSPTFPYAQVMIFGGGSLDTSRTFQIINLSELSPEWQPATSFPVAPGQTQPTSRVNVNPVLLPDGTVFLSGGASAGEPCWTFNPNGNSWAQMANAPRARQYHSHALLLPTGEVMSSGWQNNSMIDIFAPPYLFKGARPEIDSVPDVVHLGDEFEIYTHQAYAIKKVVLVRPMAPTHNTDSEQRVVQLQFNYYGEYKLTARVPNGWHPHATAPRGYYMLFILNYDGVPSVAKFVRLD